MKKYSILAIDDDPIFTQLLLKTFAPTDFNLIITHNHQEFLEKFPTQNWNICLVDLNLNHVTKSTEARPEKTGEVLISFMRDKLKYNGHVIVISRFCDPQMIAHILEIGADDFLVKPLDADLLLTKIYYLMDQQYQRENNIPLTMFNVPEKFKKGAITFQMRPYTVSEDGLVLTSTHLVSKGTFLQLKGHFIEEILCEKEVHLMVTHNSKLSENLFSLNLEFGPDHSNFSTLAKRWIQLKLRT